MRRLEFLRRCRGMKLRSVAANVDRSVSTLSLLERGRRDAGPTLRAALERLFGEPYDQLMRLM